MTLKNQEFDKILVELNAKISEIQKQIEQVNKAKTEYIKSFDTRRATLEKTAVEFKKASVERHGGSYYIIGEDDTSMYVIKLAQYPTEVLADDLDHQLGVNHIEGKEQQLLQDHILNNMFTPILKKIQ